MKESKKSVSNVPNLRFPEFYGEWEVKKLGEIECIRYGELYTHYGEVITAIKSKTNIERQNLIFSKANDVIIPASGETQLDIATASCVLKSEVALGGDLNIIRSTNNGLFLSYCLNYKKKKEIANLAQGVSVVHLYSGQLATLEVNFPCLEEQNRVAYFLSLLDERIITQKEIIQRLESLMSGLNRKIFTQKIKFKDEEDNAFPKWEKKKLGEVLNYEQPSKYIVNSTEYNDTFKTPVLTAGKTFILGYTDEVENVFTNYPVIIFDDFTMASQFVNFPFKVKSSAMKILKNDFNLSNITFIYAAIQMINYPKGDEHKRFWISEYSKIKIPFPSFKEQNRIANFVSDFIEKMKTEEELLEQYQNQKKYFLQNMFI